MQLDACHCNFIDLHLNNLYNFPLPAFTPILDNMLIKWTVNGKWKTFTPFSILCWDNVSKQMVKNSLETFFLFTSLIPRKFAFILPVYLKAIITITWHGFDYKLSRRKNKTKKWPILSSVFECSLKFVV